MKLHPNDLALLGGPKSFSAILPVGQINIPEWERFKIKADEIFDRKYYSNHGLLAQEFEEKLCELLNVTHAVTLTNATIGLALACKALGLKAASKVIVPAFTFAASVQALTWAGLEPVFCDINPRTHNITAETVAPHMKKQGVSAVLGVHLWGNPCDISGLELLSQEYGIPVFYDAAHAIGCTYQNQFFGAFGSCEVFSFHATKVLSATEGGCVTTNDDALAERLRNLRSSYGRRADVPIPVNANGRFSEMQAAFALLSLEDFAQNCAANKQRMQLYASHLHDLPGIRLVQPSPGERHNYQYVVFEIDKQAFGLDRDTLVKILEAENILARRYFVPGMHRCEPYKTDLPQYRDALPVTDSLCEKVMQLPSGQLVSNEDIGKICELMRFIQTNATNITKALPQ